MPHLFILPDNLAPYQVSRLNALVVKGIDLDVVAVQTQQNARPWKDAIPPHFQIYLSTQDHCIDLIFKLSKIREYESIIFSGYGQPFWSLVQKSASLECRKGLFVDSFESRRKSILKELYKKWMLPKYIDFYITPGHRQAEYLRGLIGNAEIIISPYLPFERQDITLNSCRSNGAFLCISRLSGEKNLHRLLKAYAVYRNFGGERELVLVGDGPLRNAIVEEISLLGLDGSVSLTGWLGLSDVKSCLQDAFALVLPSLYEPFGVVASEAIQFGVPLVISNKCGACGTVALNYENALFFDPNSSVDISDRLRLLDNDPQLYRSLRAGAESFSDRNDLHSAIRPLVNYLNFLSRSAA